VSADIRAEPGKVMVFDDAGALRLAMQMYDPRVAGVISGAGDLTPGLRLGGHLDPATHVPLALAGKVDCKVDAGHGAVEVGDLLTTSSTPGHAMNGDDVTRAFGANVGKALRAPA
jgi:hypothetical protein